MSFGSYMKELTMADSTPVKNCGNAPPSLHVACVEWFADTLRNPVWQRDASGYVTLVVFTG
jgi:hypothetical protein